MERDHGADEETKQTILSSLASELGTWFTERGGEQLVFETVGELVKFVAAALI